MRKYRRLLKYARPHRGLFVGIGVLTLASSGLAVLQPVPMKLLVDHVLGDRELPPALRSFLDAVSIHAGTGGLLAAIVLAGLVLFALQSLLNVGLTRAWTVGGRSMVYRLAEDLFSRLQRRSLLHHAHHPVGDTMGRVTADSWCVYQLADTLLFSPVHALLTVVLMVTAMSRLDATMTMLSLVLAPLTVAASFLAGKPLRAAAKLKREIEARIQSHIQQTLTGIPVVQSFVQEEREQERFRRFADAAIAAQQRSTLVGSINSLSSGLIATLGSGGILWIGARHALDRNLSVGDLLAFLFWFGLLQAQVKALADVYTRLQGLSASVDRVIEVLDTPPEVSEKPGAATLFIRHGLVQVQNVTFGYDSGQPVLRNLSLTARPGETVAIVGATGAGKTTLVNLVPRFFDPWEGRVLIDGADLRDVTLKSLRNGIAVVLQDPFLFPLSVADNIAYGKPGASRDEIESAARAANAHEFIARLDDGYDTVLSERGATLSGGERQRLAIARALLKDAPILILDEPTSAVDAETERSILEALERLRQGRTTFLIAHRLSTVRSADRIVVLKDGGIAESGTPGELLARGELYAQMQNVVFQPRNAVAVAG
jgi:ATP-binding cassette subfamily B protein